MGLENKEQWTGEDTGTLLVGLTMAIAVLSNYRVPLLPAVLTTLCAWGVLNGVLKHGEVRGVVEAKDLVWFAPMILVPMISASWRFVLPPWLWIPVSLACVIYGFWLGGISWNELSCAACAAAFSFPPSGIPFSLGITYYCCGCILAFWTICMIAIGNAGVGSFLSNVPLALPSLLLPTMAFSMTGAIDHRLWALCVPGFMAMAIATYRRCKRLKRKCSAVCKESPETDR